MWHRKFGVLEKNFASLIRDGVFVLFKEMQPARVGNTEPAIASSDLLKYYHPAFLYCHGCRWPHEKLLCCIVDDAGETKGHGPGRALDGYHCISERYPSHLCARYFAEQIPSPHALLLSERAILDCLHDSKHLPGRRRERSPQDTDVAEFQKWAWCIIASSQVPSSTRRSFIALRSAAAVGRHSPIRRCHSTLSPGSALSL
jgi:hypothetical protein